MSNNSKAKSNYDKLYKVLSAWYTPNQINEIWTMLKDYDQKPQALDNGSGILQDEYRKDILWIQNN